MKKRLITLIISCILLVSALLGATNVSAANTTDSSEKPWLAPYRKIIEDLEKEYPDSELTYNIIYFNRGKTPELVAGHDGYWVSMYTFEDGEVYTVMDHWPYGAMGNAGYYYYPKRNMLLNYNNDFAGARCYTYYGRMKNHEIVDYYKKELYMDMFIDKDKNGMPDQSELLDGEWIYYYGGKEITEEKYDSMLIQGKTKLIIGRLSAEKMLEKLK